MAGLLDALTGNGTPEQNQQLTALAAGLLSANGSQGLSAGLLGMNKAKMDSLQQTDLAQQIQMRNIALQQQQQEWAAIQPALAAYAARQGGAAGAASAPAQPAIPSLPGGSLGSGTAGISVGGQSAQTASPAPASGASDPFGLDNIIQGRVVNMFGGAPAAAAFWDRAKLPDAVKTNNYYGMNPADVSAAMQRENAAKGQMLVRQGSTLGRTNVDGSFTPFFTAPDTKDNANITWVNGSPQAAQIPGLLAGIQGVEKAKTAGAGEVLPFSGVDASGNPLPVTNRTLAATQGANPSPPIAPIAGAQPDDPRIQTNAQATPFQRTASDIAALQREIASVNKSMAPAPVRQQQLDILNAELGKAQAAAHVTQLFTGSPAEVISKIAAMPAEAQGPALAAYKAQTQQPAQPQQAAPVAGSAQTGAIYSAPPLGAVPNADAAQKASAQTMLDSYGKLQSNGSTANAAKDAIDKMLALAQNKNPLFTAGFLGTNQSAVNPDAAEYEKQRANVIALLAQQGGTNGTDAGRALTGESVPDFGKPKTAIADGLGTLRNQVTAMQMKRDLLTPIYQGGDSRKYTTLENQFDQNVSPAMIPLLTMAAGAQRAAALQAAAKDPAMRARLNWAAENGLLK